MKTHWLVIYLEETPRTHIIHGDRNSLLDGYSPLTSFPGSTGHFDWLRAVSRNVFGVRYWPFDDAIHMGAVQSLFGKCQSLDYAVVDQNKRFVSILFVQGYHQVNEDISNDQELGENGIYENEQGDIALCFEIDPSLLDCLRVATGSVL